MARACGTCEEQEKYLWLGNLKERDQLDDPDLRGRIISKLVWKDVG
jgi:hypothetical protein